jgi:myo-inositol catabolism protein IolC
MERGYSHPLYLLPFDHRHSYLTGMFGILPPLTADQTAAVIASKRIIYDGFREAVTDDVIAASAGVLVDEEFGYGILRDAARRGYVTALAVEQSGKNEFAFEYGDMFATHIEAFGPTFVKALVRYNPEGDPVANERQVARLRRLSDYCRSAGQRFMFELLVPSTEAQLTRSLGDETSYDRWMRPALTVEAIRTLQDAGVEPDVWKIEGFDRREDYERVVAVARRGARSDVGCIVLGRQGDVHHVERWLETAASVPGIIGFAVGRTTYWEAIADYLARRTTRHEAALRIALRFRKWTRIFEHAHQVSPSAAS